MKTLRFFIDTHDRERDTFPAPLTSAQFAAFYAQYQEACRAEGVVPLRIHVGNEAGRAFCFNMAADAEAVRRVHERVGLPFDSITEVASVTPGDFFLQRPDGVPA